ncbi:DUF1810 domain-containing protein [Patulibacter sp.]|uniref:DUF1810 domain-containing protein n=1 Tax=Patulibacter sp. TaxID=1912859 RepID=UPI0027290708|nr:DUF1810 domain-containing protein [Patulibacter sp.]MDO9407652.1 DUF1810 domain-containing protein [Patulibacter sp.]
MSTDTDPFDLERFVEAQDAGDTYGAAVAELSRGRKTSHWMWFVFPQVAGLGSSPTARRFAISGLEEARAYLRHPVLGPRLRESVDALLAVTGASAEEVLGGIDALKLRSSMTLFLRAAPDEERFSDVLHRHYGGRTDDATDEQLRGT